MRRQWMDPESQPRRGRQRPEKESRACPRGEDHGNEFTVVGVFKESYLGALQYFSRSTYFGLL